jgi:hypothetical protein
MAEIDLNRDFLSLPPKSGNFLSHFSNHEQKIRKMKFGIKIECHKCLGIESV